ncbi:MAG: hypothetical protein HYT11_03610 [Candidatus Levybacteria bacterium]|nr:hypothetical protein [Candidatus Levybacteria bacterium]
MQTADTQESPTSIVPSQTSQMSEGLDSKTSTQQQGQHNSKKLVGVVVTVVLILLGVGSFVLIARKNTLPLPIPLPQVLQPARPLQGAWKAEQTLLKDQATGEYKQFQFPGDAINQKYMEFKGDTVCSSGYFDQDGKPKLCQEFKKFTLDKETIILPDGQKGQWKVEGEMFTIDLSGKSSDGKEMQIRFVLRKLSPALFPALMTLDQIKQDSPDDPRELVGLWEFEQYIKKEGDKEERFFSGALEIKENTYCSKSQFNNQTSEFICNEYESYTVQGNIIKFGTGPDVPWNPARWNIVNGKLTLEDTIQPFLPIQVFKKRI